MRSENSKRKFKISQSSKTRLIRHSYFLNHAIIVISELFAMDMRSENIKRKFQISQSSKTRLIRQLFFESCLRNKPNEKCYRLASLGTVFSTN